MKGPNAVLIWCLADDLNQNITGSLLIRAFTTSKTELWLEFENHALGVTFFKGQAWVFTSDPERLPLKNRLPVFQEIHGLRLKSVEQIPEERAFKLDFGRLMLEFRLFGNKSVLYLFRGDGCLHAFPVHYEVGDYVTPINMGEASEYLNFDAWKRSCPYLLPFMSADSALLPSGGTSMQWFLSLSARLCASTLWMCEYADLRVTLSITQDSTAKSCIQGSWSELSARFTRRFIAFTEAHALYSAEWSRLKRLESMLSKQIDDRKNALEQSNTASYHMQADNIMAYMHVMQKGMDDVKLNDIYTGNDILIPLKKELNPQENAERLYRKAKKEHIRQEYLTAQLSDFEEKLKRCRDELSGLSPAAFLHLKSKSAALKTADELPKRYYLFQSGGFEIRVGKNAAGNEQLLQEAHKNDWWLHARNGRGAHVLIRCGNGFEQVPERVKEYAASLAAWNSELKNSSLVPVIITQRKYVRKAKGLASGAVIVTREEVLLVPPFDPSTSA